MKAQALSLQSSLSFSSQSTASSQEVRAPLRVLIVEDDRDLRELEARLIKKLGHEVSVASNGYEAQQRVQEVSPDIVLLDVMMPEMDGWEVCKRLKADPSTSSIPVLFLTAKGSEVDEVVGLELGADDYIVKPISVSKLLARIKAVLRRQKSPKHDVTPELPEVIRVDRIEINVPNYTVAIGSREVTLTRKEFQTLVYLAQHRGRVITRENLLNIVWGEGVHVVDRTVDVHISKIREKLGQYGEYIETVKGVGYRLRS